MNDIIDRKFGRLIIISTYMKQGKNCRRTWAHCICECGVNQDVVLSNLKSGHTKSCGCLRSEKLRKRNYKHGESSHPLINVLNCMKKRCTNVKNKDYYSYGGRGITVCKEWEEFINFYNWSIKNGWKKDLQIDRIDNDGNYTPKNCRFVTRKQNSRNRRDNVFLTAFGETKTMSEWSEDLRCNTKYSTMSARIRRGWNHEEAISKTS